jgi:hypothetical protein
MTEREDEQREFPGRDNEPGAENEQSEAGDSLPGAPEPDKDAPAGDTDQHSSSNA